MKQKKQIIIFTDLDGSLLDKDTFRFDEIEDYFRELISIGIKIIPNSSKTEAELSNLTRDLRWKSLKAVKANEVYLTDGNQYFNRPGPRLLDSIKIMDDIINNTNVYNFKNYGWKRLSEN